MRRNLFSGVEGEAIVPPRKRDAGADLDITPMIDVTFLLLIFFMVTSTMQSRPDLDVPMARHGVGVEMQDATVITVRAAAGPNAAPTIVLGDAGGPTGTVDDVARYVSEGVAAHRTRVIIKAEGDVPEGLVQEIAQAVNSVEGAEIFVGVRDEPVQ